MMPVMAFGASPVLHFSDLTWGPKTGWEGSAVKGAAVTVWGENFGSSRGASVITVNGAQLTAATDYAEWGAASSRGLQRITFWLNSNCANGAGNITVTVNGVASNALPFAVAAGTIYFVSPAGNNSNNGLYSTSQGGANGPFHDIYMFGFQNNPSGDAQYIVYARAGTYTAQDPAGDSTAISYRGPSGGPGKQKALVAYPAETPVIDATGMSRGVIWNADYSPYGRNSYLTYSKLTVVNGTEAIYVYGDYNRVVGNHFQNMLDMVWSGIVFVGNSQHTEIDGNFFDHCGSTSQGSYKHNIYILSETLSQVLPSQYTSVGWNEFSNPEAGSDNRGGAIFMRTDSSVSSTLKTQYVYIHDNNFHGGTQNFIEIGDGPQQSDIWIYNNIFTGGSSVNSPISVLWTTTNANLFNNTFYQAGSPGVSIVDVVGNPPGSQLKSANNIFYGSAGQQFFYVESGGTMTSDHDLFFSAGGATAIPGGSGLTVTNPVTGDPRYVSPGSSDFHLQSTSPAINAGTNTVNSIVTKDYDGLPRPQGSQYDIGAFEYSTGGTPSISVSIVPGSVTLFAGGTQQFTATVSGSSNTAVTWSFSPVMGTLSAAGLYTAPASISTVQSVQVTATSVADPTKSSVATITLNPTVTVSVSPAAISLGQGQTQQFSATVGGTTNTAVTWSLTGAGTLSAAGLYTAPASIPTQQSVQVRATSVAVPTQSAAATITLTPPAPVVTVSVSPASVSLGQSQTQQFTATVSVASNKAVTWSLTGAGTLSAAGLYTAPASITTQQSAQIRATSVADTTKSATATVTLTPPAAVAVTVSPASVILGQGQTQQFTATVNASNKAVTWSLTGVGTLSGAGLYTAPASIPTQQSAQVRATSVADPTKSASATVTLSPPTGTSSYKVSFTKISSTQLSVAWSAPAGHSSYDTINLTGDDSVNWWYTWQGQTGKSTSGTFLVNTPTTAGLWQFQYIDGKGSKVMAQSADLPVNVSQFSVSATPAKAAANSNLKVSWTAPSGRPQTWADTIGLYRIGPTNDQPLWYQYTMGATGGSFTAPAPATSGVYEFRYVMDYLMGARSAPVTVP
jgi:hypothetical protein